MNGIHQCDFCNESIKSDDDKAMIYDCRDFVSNKPISMGFKGAWLACATCSAFIYQYDNDLDPKAKHNLSMRCMEKFRRKYGLRDTPDPEVNKILMQEVLKLHEAFWRFRTDAPPTPYAIKQIEG